MNVDTHRVHAALHHSRIGNQAGETVRDEPLEDFDVGLIRHLVPLVWICRAAIVVTYL